MVVASFARIDARARNAKGEHPAVVMRATARANGRAFALDRSKRRGDAHRALPPGNEIAGFVVGVALVALGAFGRTLDGAIARAQARALEDEAKERGNANARAREVKAKQGNGRIFVLPSDDGERADER